MKGSESRRSSIKQNENVTSNNNKNSSLTRTMSQTGSFLPLRTRNQIIVPYSEQERMFILSQNDAHTLQQYIKDKKIISETLANINENQKLNPQLQSTTSPKYLAIYFILLLFLVIILYIFIGVFLLFLGSPVIFIFLIIVYTQICQNYIPEIKQKWTEQMRLNPIQQYLNTQNRQYFKACGLNWTLGQKGHWIQIQNQSQNL